VVSWPEGISAGELDAMLRVGHELAVRARRFGAERLAVELVGASGPLWLTFDRGAVWAAGEGFDVELSAMPGWQRARPPGA
jgi:hypothetical protein